MIPSHIRIQRLISGLCLVALSLLTGCIKGGDPACEPETDLYIRVTAVGEGGNTVLPDAATVFLFDKELKYLEQVPVSGETIAQQLPVRIPSTGTNVSRVVVWGNLGDREIVSELTPGISLTEILMTLRTDAEGYSLSPDELFYGIKPLSGQAVEVVDISPKTARISITARRLGKITPGDTYFFTVESGYGGYFFTGAPYRDDITLKLPGEFTSEQDLVTPRPYHLIHYPETPPADTEPVSVRLWRTSSENSPELLTSVNRDTNGNPILPQAGKTVNVLIDFNEGGGLEVRVVITGWGELYLWDEW